ncbi:thioredoxin-disulfide reductase [Candidatus Dojkabacteria bacterium]|uniref:Thioredoxin reductase n=1 Tax=Candidatus Dojkabacteria bacterium TaxID=2099670 RepID=A0A955HYG3_9BACT|nr:thioredoxin-disulfide reductase [Candidatus Dojkabacteria bacterium]MCB9790923.1 thioredoxin-disulfide reductase [Candidatus Nomurabacteria bacterium]
MDNIKHYDIIIIGSGPAGLTAAIYSARANLKTLVLAGDSFGGQLMTTTLVENYPGFVKGVVGPELMTTMIKQAQNQGAELIYKTATKVDFSDKEKKLVSTAEADYTASAVVIATGSSPRTLDIPGEKEFWGKGVSTCATCDGAFYKDKTVAVVGGGDSAMEEAIFLTRFAKKVYVIHRRDEFRASKVMQDRLFENEKIKVIWNTEVKEILGGSTVTELKIFNNRKNTISSLQVDGLFLAIGHIPNSQIFEGQVDSDERGYIMVTDHTHTSVEGVFVSGDVHDHHYQQAITAAGMGSMAAIDAEKWLAAQK